MSKQEKIMQLLESGKIIRLLDGRCGSGFVDMPALTALINQKRVKVYDNQGVNFVRAYTPAELLALEAAKVATLKQAAREFYEAVPLDVLRMQAGNGFLDMERVDNAAAKLAELLK